LKKAGQVADTIPMGTEQAILHKCRNCNRTDRRAYTPSGEEQCSHCNSPMDPLEIRYKCVNCGHMTWGEAGSSGRSCHKCGYRIFVKPRKDGMAKVLKAE
tara:strand:+ start:730 stop:1029 length:300 start_codon:yes stop_codon:yes gene_type:complete